jgi:hypothetical protein
MNEPGFKPYSRSFAIDDHLALTSRWIIRWWLLANLAVGCGNHYCIWLLTCCDDKSWFLLRTNICYFCEKPYFFTLVKIARLTKK